jgi:hypothetical protein
LKLKSVWQEVALIKFISFPLPGITQDETDMVYAQTVYNEGGFT